MYMTLCGRVKFTGVAKLDFSKSAAKRQPPQWSERKLCRANILI
jgi:hypothetical protein